MAFEHAQLLSWPLLISIALPGIDRPFISLPFQRAVTVQARIKCTEMKCQLAGGRVNALQRKSLNRYAAIRSQASASLERAGDWGMCEIQMPGDTKPGVLPPF
jgi:hypothetical protein